jgi:hypothetical protein
VGIFRSASFAGELPLFDAEGAANPPERDLSLASCATAPTYVVDHLPALSFL